MGNINVKLVIGVIFGLASKKIKDHTCYIVRNRNYKCSCDVTIIIILTFDCHTI